MQCQIPGCKNNHIRTDEGSGIFSGVHLEWKLCHCCCHTRRELLKAREDQIKKLLDKNSLVNPFMGVSNELGKAAS